MIKQIFWMVWLLALSSGPAYGCGRLSLNVTNISEEWGRNIQLSPEDVIVTRSSAAKECNFFITFAPGQSHSRTQRVLRHKGTQIDYQLYGAPFRDEGRVLRSYPGAVQSSNVLSGSFFKGQSSARARLSYYFGVSSSSSPRQFPNYGIYEDTVIVSVYQGNLAPGLVPDDQVQVSVRMFIPRMINLSMGAPGAAMPFGERVQSMDFGTLRTGDSRDMDLRVLSNSNYRISFSSTNNGVLRQEDKSVSTTVPYRVQVDSAVLNLAGSHGEPVVVAAGHGGSPSGSSTHNVRITIGDVKGKMAGKYQDVITMFATTIE